MAYSWGACLVILGATFKIIHFPYDDVFLIIGMTTEIIIFFISGFDEPAREFKWTRVFPQLDSRHTAEPAHQPAVQIEESMKRLNESIEKVSKEYVSRSRCSRHRPKHSASRPNRCSTHSRHTAK